MCYFTGIDVSKDKVDIGWLRDVATGKKKTKVFRNTEKGHQQIADWLLKNIQVPADEIVVALEPTGVYHEALLYFLHECGFKMLLVNPGKARKYAESVNLIHKTDKLDAVMLAYYAHDQHNKLTLWQPEAPEVRELKVMALPLVEWVTFIVSHYQDKDRVHQDESKWHWQTAFYYGNLCCEP